MTDKTHESNMQKMHNTRRDELIAGAKAFWKECAAEGNSGWDLMVDWHLAQEKGGLGVNSELEKAIQQFTGYRYAEANCFDITGLALEMGLTAKEWRAIRGDVQWLGQSNLDELDEHFKGKTK